LRIISIKISQPLGFVVAFGYLSVQLFMGTVLTSYLQILALCTYVRTYFLQRDPLWSSLSRQGLYPCFSLLLWWFTKFFAGQLIPGPPYRHVFFNRFNCFSFNPSPISGGACEQIAALRYCRVVLSIYEECTFAEE